MKNLVVLKEHQVVTSSLRVAEVFKKRHDNVLRDIGGLLKNEEVQKMFTRGEYINGQNGQKYPLIYMTRDGFTLLAMGFTGSKALEFKLKYIDAFNKMEAEVNRQPQLPTSPRGLAKLALAANEETNVRLDGIEGDVKDLKNNQVIAPSEYGYISHQVAKAVSEWVRVHPFVTTQQQRAKLYRDISRGLNEVTGVKTRTQLRRKDFDTADEFIANWQPSTATVQIIKQLSGEAAGQTSMEV